MTDYELNLSQMTHLLDIQMLCRGRAGLSRNVESTSDIYDVSQILRCFNGHADKF
jgi:hypothetical protein